MIYRHSLPDVSIVECVKQNKAFLNSGLTKHGASEVYYAPRINLTNRPQSVVIEIDSD